MRVILRSQLRAPSAPPPPPSAGPRAAGDARRAWIEALFGDHLPRGRHERERAIAVLAADRGLWAMLHQARHSMAETTATLERLARRAVADLEPLRAA
jgi:hypothetical protein